MTDTKDTSATHRGVSSRGVAMGITLFVLIVVGMSMFVYLKRSEIQQESNSRAVPADAAEISAPQ